MAYYVLFKCPAQGVSREVRALSIQRDNFMVETPAMEFLHQQYRSHSAHCKGMKRLFQNYATKGRGGLTSEMLHEASRHDEIWRFSRGQLRIYCFFDGNHIVLTHGSLKKTQRTDPADITKAKEAKSRYFS